MGSALQRALALAARARIDAEEDGTATATAWGGGGGDCLALGGACLDDDPNTAATCDSLCLTPCEIELLSDMKGISTSYIMNHEPWLCRAVEAGHLTPSALLPGEKPVSARAETDANILSPSLPRPPRLGSYSCTRLRLAISSHLTAARLATSGLPSRRVTST